MNKKIICLFLVLLAVVKLSSAQPPEPTNLSCDSATNVCVSFNYPFTDTTDCDSTTTFDLWYIFEWNAPMDWAFMVNFTIEGYALYGPFPDASEGNCALMDSAHVFSELTTDTAGSPSGQILLENGTFNPPGIYYLVVHAKGCSGNVSTPYKPYDCIHDKSCKDCIGSFAPQQGKKYLLSAWVREEDAPLDKLSFDAPSVSLNFSGSATTVGPFLPGGLIIDGWQRIEQEFTVPADAYAINIQLGCETGSNCFFDDVRVLPFDGSMKSYVYDPVTLRLVAELDERHYTTFYEYDEEGKLTRIKKETEKGIMTIQETKASNPKE